MTETLHFTKMHGAGNDYVYVDCFRQPPPASVESLARAVSGRHTGIGGDGLILIEPSGVADARMRMWNADGSPAEMCGNGVRCVAKYVYEHGLARRNPLRIETAAGVLQLDLLLSGERVQRVRVNMGRPVLEAARIPTTLPGNPPLDVLLKIPETGERCAATGHRGQQTTDPAPPGASDSPRPAPRSIPVTCVSLGNPHCVVFVDEPTDEVVLGIGPLIERHAAFPNRVNVEFVQVLSPGVLRLRVWERGTGETLACGTGACAAVVAGVLTGRTSRTAVCRLPGGDLDVEWPNGGDVFLTGPAVEVFHGEWPSGTARR